MKNLLLMSIFSLFLLGCNPNPNKEARLVKLETEMQTSKDKIAKLENVINMLIKENERCKGRLEVLEK